MKPPKDARYLAWVRTQPCIVTGRRGSGFRRVEAHHIRVNGMASKCSDYETVPLSVWYHTASPEAVHHIGRLAFEQRFRLDLKAIADQLFIQWQSEKAAA